MADIIKIKKGLDIPLSGAATPEVSAEIMPRQIGIVPDDYPGYIWRPSVRAGDEVSVGDKLLSDKETGEVSLVSPVSGVVKEIRRGERRKIEAVVVESAEGAALTDTLTSVAAPKMEREAIIAWLCRYGLWSLIRQRPYDIIPSTQRPPRDVFITAFDSAPLAELMLTAGQGEDLQAGVRILAALTDGKIYLGVAFGSGISIEGADVVEFRGPHPAGNVGVQISKIKPVNKGDVVWTLEARNVVRIGHLYRTGQLDNTTNVAVTGPMLLSPRTIRTLVGADLADILADFTKSKEVRARLISGNVLTGYRSELSRDFLRYPYRQITVIEEGDNSDEFMGWATMNPHKFSVKHSFPAFLRGMHKPYNFDARLRGGRRAPIVSGEFEKVFPMDIYPEFLLRAIESGDIDRMEKLGIYEVAPEDFALAEFVDTSKQPLQQIVRDGLDRLRREME